MRLDARTVYMTFAVSEKNFFLLFFVNVCDDVEKCLCSQFNNIVDSGCAVVSVLSD